MEQPVVAHKKTNVLIQYGLMSAVSSILAFVILYLLGAQSFTSPLAWLTMFIPIVFSILACIKAKKENEGFLEFRDALKYCFGIFVVTSLASSLFSFLLFNFIDPAFADALKQVTIEQTQKFMARFNTPQDTIDKAINEMIKKDLYSFGSIAQSFAQGCIVYFIISLILAAILKKKKPVFAE